MTIMSLKNCSGFLGNTFGGEQSTKPVCPSIVSPPELPKLKSNAAAALKMLVPNIEQISSNVNSNMLFVYRAYQSGVFIQLITF